MSTRTGSADDQFYAPHETFDFAGTPHLRCSA
jgi:hypothetical protein